MNTQDYKTQFTLPDAKEYVHLRKLAGLSPMPLTAATVGLPNSVISVTIRQADTLVGMGRVIGDGGLFFQIVDIAVHPEHQRRGLGRQVMHNLMQKLRETAPTGAYVSLIADDGADRLYQEFGFKPTAPRSIGMSMFLRE